MPGYTRKYSRRSSKSIRRSKRIPVIIGIAALVLLFVGIIVLIASLVGVKLRDVAQKYDDVVEIEYVTPNVKVKSHPEPVREVNAEIYGFDKSLGEFISREITDLSIMLRAVDGTVYYNSAVAGAMGWDSIYKSVDLAEKMETMHSRGGYACAYMYLSSFSDESEISSVKKEYEKQLVIEAAASGVDEIMLLGIELTDDNTRDVLQFLSDIKVRSGNCKIGIQLAYGDVVTKNPDDYKAEMMLQVCDFIALDASSVPCAENAEELGVTTDKDFYTAIEEIYYYTNGMKIRLVFGNGEVSMFKRAADATYVNRQMIQ